MWPQTKVTSCSLTASSSRLCIPARQESLGSKIINKTNISEFTTWHPHRVHTICSLMVPRLLQQAEFLGASRSASDQAASASSRFSDCRARLKAALSAGSTLFFFSNSALALLSWASQARSSGASSSRRLGLRLLCLGGVT